MIIIQHSRAVEILQHTEEASSVPVIRHTAAIIDVSRSVFEHLDGWRTKRGGRWMNALKHTPVESQTRGPVSKS